MVRRLLFLLVPLALVAGACSEDDPAITPGGSTSSTTSSTSPTTDPSDVPGEDPGPTSPGGAGTPLEGDVGEGTMDYRLVVERSEFCYQISVRGMGSPTEAHVHRSDDEVVLALVPPDEDDSVDTCAATDALLIEEINARPGNFYIDVHAPEGILRADLG